MRVTRSLSGQDVISRLTLEIERLEQSTGASGGASRVELGWPGADDATGGGLRRGAVHEWLSDGEVGRGWAPPLGVMGHIAGRALRADPGAGGAVWIGSRAQAHAVGFAGAPELLSRSLFVLAERLCERVWAIDLACRSPGVTVVVADGAGLGMSESRRLQLAASSGDTLCLLGRPWDEHGAISAAWTRWRVRPEVTRARDPHWSVRLLRCKGTPSRNEEAWRWTVRRDHETSDVRVVPELCAGSGSSARPARRALG